VEKRKGHEFQLGSGGKLDFKQIKIFPVWGKLSNLYISRTLGEGESLGRQFPSEKHVRERMWTKKSHEFGEFI